MKSPVGLPSLFAALPARLKRTVPTAALEGAVQLTVKVLTLVAFECSMYWIPALGTTKTFPDIRASVPACCVVASTTDESWNPNLLWPGFEIMTVKGYV